jgi:hypothetical protein
MRFKKQICDDESWIEESDIQNQGEVDAYSHWAEDSVILRFVQ